MFAPGPLLAWGPVLLGVPHLLADGRYLVVRRGLHSRPWALAVFILPTLFAWTGHGAMSAACCVMTAGILARAGVASRGLLVGLGLGLAWLSFRYGRVADVGFAHVHNLVALGVWSAWRRRRGRSHLWVLVAFLAFVGALASGTLDRWALPATIAAPDVNHLVGTLTVGHDPTLALRQVVFFAFAQSVHYSVWVRLLPDEDREREAPRPFVGSLDALGRDVGWPLLALVALTALVVLAWGAFDVLSARDGYLRLAAFHGPIELGLVGWLLAERNLRSSSPVGRRGARARDVR